jgi:hypothetical protein
MSIVVISSDSYRRGRKIGEKSAEALGYRYLDREILPAVANRYGIEEAKLIMALDEIPSFMGISTKLRDRCLAYIQEAVLGELLQDQVVCHGLSAHLYVHGVSHVLKVRILASSGGRVGGKVSPADVSRRSRKKAKNREKFARRWSLDAFKVDETDPSHYDLVINLGQIDADEAVRIITDTVGHRRFKPMTYSLKCLQDWELGSRVRAALMEQFPDVRVEADGGKVVVETGGLKREKQKKTAAVKALAEKIPGVKEVQVHIINDIFRQAVESFR